MAIISHRYHLVRFMCLLLGILIMVNLKIMIIGAREGGTVFPVLRQGAAPVLLPKTSVTTSADGELTKTTILLRSSEREKYPSSAHGESLGHSVTSAANGTLASRTGVKTVVPPSQRHDSVRLSVETKRRNNMTKLMWRKSEELQIRVAGLNDEIKLARMPLKSDKNRKAHGHQKIGKCYTYIQETNLNRTAYEALNIWSAFHHPDPDDITMVTQLSLNRISTLTRLIEHYGGPISAAIYLPYQDIGRFADIISQHPVLLNSSLLNMHLLVASGELYPINYLRNMALNNTKTKYVFLSDVDFVPMYNLSQHLKSWIKKGALVSKQVLVVPAFEVESMSTPFPYNKSELLDLIRNKKSKLFHVNRYRGAGHGPTNLAKWKETNDTYKTGTVRYGFEPYIVMRLGDTPRYDQRFLGRGENKVMQIYAIHCNGYNFTVLPDVFTIHYPHREKNAVPNCVLTMKDSIMADYRKWCFKKKIQ